MRFRGGSLAHTAIHVPLRSLWTDDLTITVDSIDLELVLQVASTPAPPAPAHAAQAPPVDLGASVATVTQDFLASELDAFEGADLAQSIRESLVLSPAGSGAARPAAEVVDPFASPLSSDTAEQVAPGAFPFPALPGAAGDGSSASVPTSSVLAGLVERVLARLRVSVRRVRVRVYVDGDATADTPFVELVVDGIDCHSEVRAAADLPGATPRGDAAARILRIGSMAVRMSRPPLPPPASSPASTARGRQRSPAPTLSRHSSLRNLSPRPLPDETGTSSSGSSSADDMDPSTEMMMSQAIADLRESRIVSPGVEAVRSPQAGDDAESGDESMYDSALQETFHSRMGSPLEKRDLEVKAPGTLWHGSIAALDSAALSAADGAGPTTARLADSAVTENPGTEPGERGHRPVDEILRIPHPTEVRLIPDPSGASVDVVIKQVQVDVSLPQLARLAEVQFAPGNSQDVPSTEGHDRSTTRARLSVSLQQSEVRLDYGQRGMSSRLELQVRDFSCEGGDVINDEKHDVVVTAGFLLLCDHHASMQANGERECEKSTVVLARIGDETGKSSSCDSPTSTTAGETAMWKPLERLAAATAPPEEAIVSSHIWRIHRTASQRGKSFDSCDG